MHNASKAVLTALAIILASAAPAASQQLVTPVPATNPGALVGLGYNPSTGDFTANKCIEYTGTLTDLIDQATGQPTPARGLTRSNLTHVASMHDMARELGVSTSGKVGNAGGTVRGEWEANYLRRTTNSSNHRYLVVAVDYENAPRVIPGSVRLNSVGRSFAGNARRFIANCGTHFVRGVVSGGYMRGMINGTTNASSDMQSLDAKVSGQSVSLSAKASVRQIMTDLRNHSQVSQDFVVNGQTGTIPTTEVDQMIEFAGNFPTTVTGNNAVFVRVIEQGYEGIPGVPSGYVAERRQLEDNRRRAGELSADYLLAVQDANDLQFSLANPQLFDTAGAMLRARADSATDRAADIKQRAFRCMQSIRPDDNCAALPANLTRRIGTPRRLCHSQDWVSTGSTRDFCSGVNVTVWMDGTNRAMGHYRVTTDHTRFEKDQLPLGGVNCVIQAGTRWFRVTNVNADPPAPAVQTRAAIRVQEVPSAAVPPSDKCPAA
jgi:hypothetical protein